ncbi:MAG: outer membrane protein assembly factor BamA [Gammaproteobacteria bacterium]|nr:outer membrane protein assembly factor BamA [Gammaproteobacteria bacterium]
MKKAILAVFLMALFKPVFAIDPFIIADIRVEGLERLDTGTVFNYLPLKVGDEANDEEISLSIKELFRTGFFRDISLQQEGTTLVVQVTERPSIASITIQGNRKLKTEVLETGLEQAGIVQGRIFNVAQMKQVEKEIKDTYLSLGRYSATVDYSVDELDDNRVNLTIDINEGRVARIKKINIIGTKAVRVKDLKDEMLLKEKRGWRVFSRQDQYSKQKLEADLESIRSYYQNRGYHEFELVSSSVDISQNKQSIFISITVDEGERFTFGEVSIEGVDEEQEAALRPRIKIKPGKSFSRKVVNQTRAAITDWFSGDGYAFVEVEPTFETDQDTKVVHTVFSVVINQRVYVRRIDITGNLYTRDEVIRRELRQFEGAWYSAAAVRRSRDRLRRMGIFSSVEIETPAVPGTSDQVDLKVVVSELDTGSLLLSAGYSDEDGALLGVEFEQRNLLGTGKDLSLEFKDSDAVDTAVIRYNNPYHTIDGVSRGFHLTTREIDASETDSAEYLQNTDSVGVNYKVPIAETNSVNFGASYEKIELKATTGTPDDYVKEINEQAESDSVVLSAGLSRDTRDDFFFPTRGATASASMDLSVPGSELEYYKIYLSGSYYHPLSESITLKGNLSLGYGDGFGDSDKFGLPFHKHFFAGGARSVRGYDARSLGPTVETTVNRTTGTNASNVACTQTDPCSSVIARPSGGDARILTHVEVLFPAFGSANTKDKRLGLFVDGGQVYEHDETIDLGDMRYSTGLFFHWFSALGPLSISYAHPLNDKSGDDLEELQLSIGTVFR